MSATIALAELSSTNKGRCLHCALPVGPHSSDFCCRGCQAVHTLIHDKGLARFYELGGGQYAPVSTTPKAEVRLWLSDHIEALKRGEGARLTLDVQGMHCSACVWLLQQVFYDFKAARSVSVNSSTGRMTIWVGAAFSLGEFVGEVERLGYRVGPSDPKKRLDDSSLLLRLGVCLALSMNIMMFALAEYLGLSEGSMLVWFRWLSFLLSLAIVLVGGSFFVLSALRFVRRRAVHVDQPIALAIVLSFSASAIGFLSGNYAALYFDSIGLFVTLMLLGTYLRQRVVTANQFRLLADTGVEGLLSRRVENGKPTLVPSSTIECGDRLVLAANELLPVDARLSLERSSFSLDWITGESTPRTFAKGQSVPAGAFTVDGQSALVTATEGFSSSRLLDLLRDVPESARDSQVAVGTTARLIKLYILVVVAVAGLGGVFWFYHASFARALDVMTAVLVVSCPCALGIAIPLAHDFATSGLRRHGLFVRSSSFLSRAKKVQRIAFDKTGTLTDPCGSDTVLREIGALTKTELDVFYSLSSSSGHPASAALARCLAAENADFVSAGLHVRERPGVGVQTVFAGRDYRVGRRAFANGLEDDGGVHLSIDGKEVGSLVVRQRLRSDARKEISQLRGAGYGIAILSGDRQTEVDRVSSAVGVDDGCGRGDMSPEDKDRWLKSHGGGETLFIGDGINDTLAVGAALCSGTPSVDRPFLASRTDFYFTTPGLWPIRLALRVAKRLDRVAKRNVAFAIAYNVSAIGLALSGYMKPWLAAVLMPLSSIFVVTLTTLSLSRRSTVWKF